MSDFEPRVWRSEKARAKREKRRLRRQRVKKGYDEMDVMDVDQWFIRTVHAMLVDERAHLESWPTLTDDGEYVHGPGPELVRIHDEGEQPPEAWLRVLDRMIWLSGELERGHVPERTAAEKEHMAQCRREFFALFSKYFYSLWG